MFAIFFLLSGYEAEDAVVLLRIDLASLSFVSVPVQQMKPGPYAVMPKHIGLMDHLLALSDAFEIAAQSGDSATAYRCLHSAADLLLPRETVVDVECLSQYDGRLSEVFALQGPNGRSIDSEIPLGYQGPADLPVPLLRIVFRIVGR